MPSCFVRAQRVRFGFSEPLFEDVSFDLPAGWTGVVGANGAGKTTLLRLVAGELEPGAGVVAVRGRVVVCPQLVDDGAASFGERRRWQLEAALARGADVLLLDEPGNHLDAGAREWLIATLLRFEGIGVLVSHDRALLDAICAATLRLAHGSARLYPGAYSAARPLWEAQERAVREERDARAAREKALRARLAQARRDQEAAAARLSTGRRMRSRHDSDARGLGANFRVEMAEKRLGRNVQVLRKAHERAIDDAAAIRVAKEAGRPVFVGYRRAERPWLLRLDDLSVSREDRIWIRGPNGAGKSTLLRRLAAAMPAEQLLYLPQDLTADEAQSALRNVRDVAPEERGRVLSMVAALGVDPGRMLASRSPSPGEARKLLIATGLGRHVRALLLDEPTNHLDLPSIERLEAALREYPGALVLVSHDEAFARSCTARELSLSAGASPW